MLNENLSKIRKEQGLTQEALAVKLNVVRQTISKWEKGTAVPDADTLCRIAQALEVPVASLLGTHEAKESDEKADTALIASALSQINEQLAVRNRHTANVWKAICLILLIVIGIFIGRIWFASHNSPSGNNEPSAFVLPETVEISGVGFTVDRNEIFCTFVPSTGNPDIIYTVTMHALEAGLNDLTVTADYQNGVCTATFKRAALFELLKYNVVLSADYCGDIRNITLAEGFDFYDDVCEWTSQWANE